ncbi:MAG: hypothetical protein EOP45_17455 [Sphingobacteriaceae bacterium]|nr:MAG: hypothetical protein EOP45_17455 [Sphingobacteriaceae bacterium]
MDYETDGIIYLPDREFVDTMAPIAVRNCTLLIQIFVLRSTLVEHLWFWELILSYPMDFKTERFWTYVVFAHDLKGLFRTIWQRRQWPWCDISLENIPIVLTGKLVISSYRHV